MPTKPELVGPEAMVGLSENWSVQYCPDWIKTVNLTDMSSSLKFSSTVQPINKNNDHSKNGTAPNGMPLPAVVVTSEVDPNGPVDKVWLILYKLEDMSSPGRPIIMHKEEYRKHSVAIVIVQNKTLNSQQVDWISMVTTVESRKIEHFHQYIRPRNV